MGDGQHVWAAAEWVIMMRNLFLREEDRVLVIGSGLPEEWLRSGRTLSFGPGPTTFGPVKVAVAPKAGGWHVTWEAAWRNPPACLIIRLQGYKAVSVTETRSGGVDVPDTPERVNVPAGSVNA